MKEWLQNMKGFGLFVLAFIIGLGVPFGGMFLIANYFGWWWAVGYFIIAYSLLAALKRER